MILERVEKDGIVKAIYESSNIVASSYDKVKKDLNITFKHGGNYTYQGVGDTDYMRFETAGSQGKVLNSNLKKYPFLKHEPVDVDEILEQIKDINEGEVNAMLLGIEDAMVSFQNSLNSMDKSDKSIINSKLDKVTEMINVYNEMKK